MAKNSQHARPFYVHIATLFFVLFLVMGCVQLALGFRQHYQSAYAYRIESHSQRSAELGRALQLLQNSGSARSTVAFAKQLSDLLADMNPSGQNRLLLCDSKGQILAATGYGRIPDSSMARSMGTAFQDSLLVHFADSLSAWNKSQDSNWVLHSSHYGLVIQTLHVTALPGDQQGALYLAQTLPIQALRSEVFYESLRGMRPALAAMLLLFPAVWLVAKRTTTPLILLKKEMNSIRHFNFSGDRPPSSHIQEINDLIETMAGMKSTIREFMVLGKTLAAEHRFEPLMTAILQEALKVAGAQGGVMYLRDNNKADQPFLAVRAFWQREEYRDLPPIHEQEHLLKAAANGLRQCDLVDEAAWQRDFTSFKPYAPDFLTIAEPLFDCHHKVIGILALLVPRADQAELSSRISLVEALAGSAAVSIETQQLIGAQKKLLRSLIELLASAIDAKSPYTGGHCQRVPVLTQMLAKAACDQREGPFSRFNLDEDQWEALHLASWLHDCGKVTTPEFVVDKATRLETLYDRIHEIRMRFEVLKRDAVNAAQFKRLTPEQREAVNAEVQLAWKELDEEFAFVASCNHGESRVDPTMVTRLRQIASRQWERTLDDRLGVSEEERQRKERTPVSPLPARELLLSDKPEHLLERKSKVLSENGSIWDFKLYETPHLYNRGELYNLSIPQGTLTDEERFKINQHITQTIMMLDKLPLPRHLRDVPNIAGGHHEKMDGTGYPRQLTRHQLSPASRMIAIADVFEALTASDRPYKAGKTVGEALKTMADMVRKQHLDGDLFALLLTSGIWRDYAQRFLPAGEYDSIDTNALLAQAGVYSGNKDYCFGNTPVSAIM